MFHLAKTCPHCGVSQDGSAKEETPAPVQEKAKKPELKLSAEEARAMLSLAATATHGEERPVTLADVAGNLVKPRDGLVELITSVIAGPLTAVTVLVLGYLLLRLRRSQRSAALWGANALAVPVATGLLLLTFVDFEVPDWPYWLVGVSFGAWLIRSVVRVATTPAPLA
jgi:hypothetical protein